MNFFFVFLNLFLGKKKQHFFDGLILIFSQARVEKPEPTQGSLGPRSELEPAPGSRSRLLSARLRRTKEQEISDLVPRQDMRSAHCYQCCGAGAGAAWSRHF